jgi:hypothetical protein
VKSQSREPRSTGRDRRGRTSCCPCLSPSSDFRRSSPDSPSLGVYPCSVGKGTCAVGCIPVLVEAEPVEDLRADPVPEGLRPAFSRISPSSMNQHRAQAPGSHLHHGCDPLPHDSRMPGEGVEPSRPLRGQLILSWPQTSDSPRQPDAKWLYKNRNAPVATRAVSVCLGGSCCPPCCPRGCRSGGEP